jgi:RNA polymerase sigma-70 factor, ECF subfamily
MSASADSGPDELLRLARGDDRLALGQLLESYRSYLALLARMQIGRRLQGKVDASDLVQEAFLEAHRHFPQFRGTTEEELVSWLRQILADRLAKLVRGYWGTQRRDVRLERKLAAEMDRSSRLLDGGLLGKQSSPSGQAVRREQGALLAQALDELPQSYREILILRHLEGLSFPDAARQMGRSVDSVKNLWARALARLRDSLGGGS